MYPQLISPELLQKSDKILFVAHLALGDFTYMQNCFRSFARAYPHIRMHLWVDEVRRTSDESKWPHLKKYALYDWVHATGMFDRIYDQTYSPQLYRQSIEEARAENYPVVVSFAVLVRHLYAELARKLSPDGFVVAQKKRVRLLDIRKHLAYRKLDAFIPAYRSSDLKGEHISALYASWFEQLFGIRTSTEERFPYVDIPSIWQQRAGEDLARQGVPSGARLAFLNAFSKSEERSWPLERMLQLSQQMRQLPGWQDAWFVLNVVPEKMAEARVLLERSLCSNVVLFTADENFFQLPAVLALCSLIISVETAVMHLANAVHVPVIALMRQTSPEWHPIDTVNSTVINVKSRKGWITEIEVDEVLDYVRKMSIASS